MRAVILFSLIQLVIALLPLVRTGHREAAAKSNFPGWPSEFEGETLSEIGLSDRELAWAKDFPGKINRFTDGTREIVIRYVTKATRSLHPSSDCMQALGFKIRPLRIRRDGAGTMWNCFAAEKPGTSARTLCEQIRDDQGQYWSDTSSWYWQALFSNSSEHYWAITVLN